MTIRHDIPGSPPATILEGHVVEALRTLPDASVQCVVTSPPYWNMRDFGTNPQTWEDGWQGELGREPMPEDYVSHLAAIWREVWRVLRPDGVCWLNLGDKHWSDPGGQNATDGKVSRKLVEANRAVGRVRLGRHPTIRRKSLVGIPWRVAFALQEQGWILRSEVIWHKPTAAPEPMTDRPTRAHEQVFLLTKSERYYYDYQAIAESYSTPSSTYATEGAGRNARDVWTIPFEPTTEAHYAAWPGELVRRCILASTSEAGACAECGAPWRRVPTCRHTHGERVPCVVLDPFLGSGTTALLARACGRASIGIELQATYVQMAIRRLMAGREGEVLPFGQRGERVVRQGLGLFADAAEIAATAEAEAAG